MNKTGTPKYWYMAVYASLTDKKGSDAQTIDLLGDSYIDAFHLAAATMEPTDDLLSMHIMGTYEDYELYESYLRRRDDAKRNASVLRSAVTGEPGYTPEISAHSMPFDDDDTIELT